MCGFVIGISSKQFQFRTMKTVQCRGHSRKLWSVVYIKVESPTALSSKDIRVILKQGCHICWICWKL